VKSGDLIRFNSDVLRGYGCFHIPAGSVGIVLRETPWTSDQWCHSSLFEVLVDGKILFEIDSAWSIEILSEG
jgi:hypothetical protein